MCRIVLWRWTCNLHCLLNQTRHGVKGTLRMLRLSCTTAMLTAESIDFTESKNSINPAFTNSSSLSWQFERRVRSNRQEWRTNLRSFFAFFISRKQINSNLWCSVKNEQASAFRSVQPPNNSINFQIIQSAKETTLFITARLDWYRFIRSLNTADRMEKTRCFSKSERLSDVNNRNTSILHRENASKQTSPKANGFDSIQNSRILIEFPFHLIACIWFRLV